MEETRTCNLTLSGTALDNIKIIKNGEGFTRMEEAVDLIFSDPKRGIKLLTRLARFTE